MCAGCMTNVDAIGLSAIGVWAFGGSVKRKVVARLTGRRSTDLAPVRLEEAQEPDASPSTPVCVVAVDRHAA